MKPELFTILLIMVLMGTLFHPGCKTVEECSFDITGIWQVFITITDWSSTWTETLTFIGSTTSGMSTGFKYQGVNVQNGTYTVINCTTVQFIFDYLDLGTQFIWTFNGSAISDDSMSGTGTYYNDWDGTTLSLTWTAIKT